MKTIEPYIRLDWHTVPMRGTLERLPSGKKTLPEFDKGWRTTYKESKNTKATELGGVLTGALSNIIAVDCDNSLTWSMFKGLDTDNKFVFISKGKKTKDGTDAICGTFIYEYDPELDTSFSINDDTLALDFYSNNGFIYLATDANQTKESLAEPLPEIPKIPETIKALLLQLKTKRVEKVEHKSVNTITANCLAPLVSRFASDKKFMPGLFKIITPKSFRDTPQYVQEGFLHPANVPEGRGSEYLSKVSAILGADISIDHSMYLEAMQTINDLWPNPLPEDRLEATVTEPMLSCSASINGEPIWQYDEDWDAHRLIVSTKRQSSIEAGFDDRRCLYYTVDAANENIQVFSRDSELISYIGTAAVSPPNKAEVKRSIPIINVMAEPNKEFGFITGDDPTARTLNTFICTPELAIFRDPSTFQRLYKKPETTLKFLETLIPDKTMRDYTLSFIKRKLTYFEYSPVTLFFLGVHGSGKDTFVKILEKIMGKVAKPTVREFLEIFNGWMLDSYFVQLDEYGNQLSTHRDKEEALGRLKAYTGKSSIQVRQMRSEGFQYEHRATFISTANKNPFGLEDGDRRIALLSTPNKLSEADWVSDVTEVYDTIMEETKDFCYYLATEVPMLSKERFMSPPETDAKHTMIADSMFPSTKLAYVLKHGMMVYLKELAEVYNVPGIIQGIDNRVLYSHDLEDLYDIMTEHKGDSRSMNKAVRGMGIALKPSSRDGIKVYYYDLPYFTTGEFEADNDDSNNF